MLSDFTYPVPNAKWYMALWGAWSGLCQEYSNGREEQWGARSAPKAAGKRGRWLAKLSASAGKRSLQAVMD